MRGSCYDIYDDPAHFQNQRWGCLFYGVYPRVGATLQPWALLRNPFGVIE